MHRLFEKALRLEFLTLDEGLMLYNEAPTSDLIFTANELRKMQVDDKDVVTWQIDRNVNITNVCVSQCKFCNFYRKSNAPDIYITKIEEYIEKIEVLLKFKGDQLLLQGGLHPKLKIDFYENLFSELKKLYPQVKLHALGPPEIHHIARISRLSVRETLERLLKAGLDSLPGAGAEILVDRVRNIVSKAKCTTDEWLNVMREAHQLRVYTSATMMMGHVETKAERIEHLIRVRQVQAEKPDDAVGFLAFIPWSFQGMGTKLLSENPNILPVFANEYIRTVAISRMMLPNIKNIQASWLTVGKEVAQMCLHAGANDFGSIMIEENVVSAAGATHSFDAQSIQEAILQAGFTPKLRNQRYEYRENVLNGSKVL